MAFRRSGVRLPPGPPIFEFNSHYCRYHFSHIHTFVWHSIEVKTWPKPVRCPDTTRNLYGGKTVASSANPSAPRTWPVVLSGPYQIDRISLSKWPDVADPRSW